MPRKTGPLERHKEKLLFAAAALAACAAMALVLAPAEPMPEPPSEPTVAPPPDAGAVLGAGKLYAAGSYWDDAARYVFVEPEKVRIFQPVDLRDVPSMEVPARVMPLPEPGPFLRYSGGLQRFDGTPGNSPPAAPPAAAPETEPAKVPAGGNP